MADKERLSFEEALNKLESIVEQLEDEEITLEDSVKLYEEGVRMSKFCTEILEQKNPLVGFPIRFLYT